ncbi:MAG: hypothetical protein KF768_05015 [Phycisphaeraceae bacterium]|nr:hypothetical protein [Phycisphaeraceae bacterium]
MNVTVQLLELFQVDKELRGLTSRVDQAEKFLAEQEGLLGDLSKSRNSIENQVKTLKATVANEEGEIARLDERINTVREQMNQARNSKEYNAFQTELNTFKTERSSAETRLLEAMARMEELSAKLEKMNTEHSERDKITRGAVTQRDAGLAEVKDRLGVLKAKRDELAGAIPASIRVEFEQVVRARGDDAMATVEIIDRRAYEASCSSCMMTIPVEALSGLMSGKLTKCPSCRCFLFLEEGAMDKPSAKTTKKRTSKKQATATGAE